MTRSGRSRDRRWHASSLAIALLACTQAGCFLERHAIGGPEQDEDADVVVPMDAALRDAAAPDASRADAGPRDGGRADAGRPADSGPPDSGARDSGPPDSGPPDSGPRDSGPPDAGRPSCGSIYGRAIGYRLCEQRPTECEFVATLGYVSSCRSVCEYFDGVCIAAYDNDVGACGRGDPVACGDTSHFDSICVCSRGP